MRDTDDRITRDPFTSDDVAVRYYDSGYHRTHQKPLFIDDDYFRARAEAALDYFTPAERQGRVFDYGCGLGASIALLPNAKGWDISAEARQRCRERGLHVYDSLEEVPRHAFDVVFSRHVLEHLEEPLAALQTMRSLLVPGGRLILVVPKESHWLPKRTEPDENQHLYSWTPRLIYNLLWRAGFRPLGAEYRYPFGWRSLLPVRRRLGPRVYHAAVRAGTVFRRNGELVVRAEPIDS